MPNPWDRGSAVMLESLGFEALATTSSGFAATLGRLDGGVSRDEAIEHARTVAEAVSVPVSADLENCFADDPEGVAETVRLAAEAGLAGCSVEDYSGPDGDTIYDAGAGRRARSARPRRPRTPRRAASCSRPAPRTTCTAATTWPTRSRDSRATRRRAPTCCSRRVCASSPTSAS